MHMKRIALCVVTLCISVKPTDLSQGRTNFIFRVEGQAKQETNNKHVESKAEFGRSTKLRGFTSALFKITDVRVLNPTHSQLHKRH
jgi:hypothetical protein